MARRLNNRVFSYDRGIRRRASCVSWRDGYSPRGSCSLHRSVKGQSVKGQDFLLGSEASVSESHVQGHSGVYLYCN